MDERQHKVAAAVAEVGADWALLSRPDSVAYASGHVVPIEAGPSPFAGGPTLALVARDGTVAVVAANVEGGAAAVSRAATTELYEGFSYEGLPDIAANFRTAFQRAVTALGVGGTVAVEPDSLPVAIADLLDGRVPLSLARAKAVKTEAEVAAMRRAGAVAALGQRTFRTATRPGRTELDVFGEIRAAMENAAGCRLPVTGDFMSGVPRTAGFTAWPTDRVIAAGDPVMSDLAPRVDGYWGDSCASATVGTPTPGYLALFAASREALEEAAAIIRPGLVVADLDQRLREIVGRAGYAYPHHSGHSLGTAVHEWPRLIPAETAAIEAGMVLMVEPGAYDPAHGGVRCEWMFLVTPNGCEVLTDFSHEPAIAAA